MTDEVLGISGFGWFLVRTEGILGPDSIVDILIMVESITMALMNLWLFFLREIQKSCHPWWLHLRWSNEWPDVSRLWRRGNFFPGNGWTRWVPVLRRCVRQLHFAWARNGAFALLAAQLMALAPRSVKWQCSSEQEVKCQKYRRI